MLAHQNSTQEEFRARIATPQQGRHARPAMTVTLADPNVALCYDALLCGVTLYDAAGAIIYANPAAQELLGWRPDQLQSQTSRDPRWRAIREDGTELPEAAHPAMVVLRTGQPQRGATLGVALPHGERRWLQVDATPLCDDTGRVTRVVASFADVTARKAAEARFQALAEHGTDLVCLLAPDGTARYGSPSYARVLGAPIEELHRQAGSPLGVIHPDDRAAVHAAMVACTRDGRPAVTLTCRHRHADGSWRTLECVATNRLADPASGGVIVTSRDITARVQAEERLRALTEAATDAIIASDADGRILSWNPAAARLFGYTAEEAIGQPLTLLMPERYWAAHARGLRRLAEGGEERALGRTLELVGRRKDGSEFPIELSLSSWTTGERRFYSGIIRDVTERMALRASEERLRTVVDNAPLMLFAIDRDGIIQLAEGKGLERRGRTPGDYVGRSLFEMHADHPAILDGARRALAGETASTMSDQAGVAFETRYVPLCDASGAVTGAIGVSTDVTERVRAEAALRQSEDRYRQVQEHAPIGLALVAPDGSWLRVNPALCTLVGYGEDELLARTFQDITHPDDLDADLAYVQQVLAGEITTYQMEKRYMRKDGALVWVLLSVSLVRDEAGQPLYFISQIQDIDARKRAEEALQDSEVRFRALIAHAPVGAAVADERGVLELVNDAFAATYGYTSEEMVGQSITMLVPVEQRAALAATYAGYVARGAEVRDEYTVVTRGGERRTVLGHSVQMTGLDGRPRRATFSTDITERAHLEAELRASHAELARSNAELEQFTRVASHDLRSPLSSIGGFAQLLQLRYKSRLDAHADEYIDFITSGVARMQALIDALLAYARVDSQAKPHAPLDCAVLLRDTLANLHAPLQETGATVDAGALPTVMGDVTQINQLMQNLIGNALKFRRPGVAPEIRVSARRDGGAWLFAVRDNGIGLDPAQAARIFAMFGRLHTHEEYDGTGIGLAVCQKIVERHGGRIWVESQPGQGATFRFTLPAV